MSDTEDDSLRDTLPGAIERFCPSCERSFHDGEDHCPDDGTRLVKLSPASDPLIGRTIDRRFVIQERMGAGGMGAVYRALQTSVGREVAIKVIESRLGRDRIAAKRFLREAKLASQLSHPNTVTVIDFGQTDDGMLFLVMELLRGETLGRVLRREGIFSPARVVRIGQQLCDALEAAHRLSIIHRDLKPSNIVVLDEPPGRDLLKVLDFGLAKSLTGESGQSTVTQSDVLLGTPLYISPEAVTGAGEDHRSDLYSVGVILYELVSGKPPFLHENINMLVSQHAYDAPPPLPDHVPAGLAAVIMRLLEKDPDRRLPNAPALRQALSTSLASAPASPVPAGAITADDTSRREALAQTLPGPDTMRRPSVPPASTVERPAPARTRAPVAALSAVVAVIAIVAIVWWTQRRDSGAPAVAPAAAPADAGAVVESPAGDNAAATAAAAAAADLTAPDAGTPDAVPPAPEPPPRTHSRRTHKTRTKKPTEPSTKTGTEPDKAKDSTPRIDYRLPD